MPTSPERNTDADPLAAVLVARPRIGSKRVVPATTRDGRPAMRKDWPAQPDGRRLRHEAAVLAQLAGVEGVPQLIEPFDGTSLLLEAVPSIPLTDVWRGEPLAPDTLLPIAAGLARVLAGVHARGVVHKNLTPHGVLLCEPAPYRVMLTDFDLSTTFAQERPGFTHHDRIAGDLRYIAPEQTGRTGRPTDHRADLYSLGATLYALATGTPPFPGDEPLALVRAHLAQLPVPPHELNPALRPDLSAAVLRLLEKEPDRRYQSATGLAHDLDLIAASAAAGGPPVTLGEHDFAERLAPPSRLVGRDGELRLLRDAFDLVVDGPAHAVLVRGAPGVGKSALIDQLRAVVTGAGGWFVAGKFDQYRRGERFGAVAQSLRSLAGLLLCEPDDTLTALRARFTAELGLTAGAVASFLPELALLTGAPPDPPGDEDPDDSRLVRGCAALLRVVADRTPVVVALDDLQWADSFSTALCDAILTDPAMRRVLVLGSYRDAEVDGTHPLTLRLDRWRRLPRPPAVLTLDNLPAADLTEFLAGMMRLGRDRAAGLAATLLPHTGGNPFDTTELVNALRRAGVLTLTGDGWQWDTGAVRRHVRQNDVLELIAARLDAFPPDTREALAALAGLGGEVGLGLLHAATGRTADALAAALRPALADGLLVLDQELEVARFAHDRVQQAACADGLHLTLARALAADGGHDTEAAQQYLAAAAEVVAPDERRDAARLLRTAAAGIRITDAPAARQLLTTALTLADDDWARRAITADLHAVLYTLGRLDEADVLWDALCAGDAGPDALADPACAQISGLIGRGRIGEALDLGTTVLARLGVTRPCDLDADTGPDLARLAAWAAGEPMPEAARRDDEDPRVEYTARILRRMSPAAFYGGERMLLWFVLECHDLWLRFGPRATLVNGLGVGAPIMIAAGDYRGAYELGRRIETATRAHGWPAARAYAGSMLAGFTQHWFEPLEDTVRTLHDAQETFLAYGDVQDACFAYHAVLPALIDCAGSLDVVAAEVEAALSLARRLADDLSVATLQPFAAWVRALRGEPFDESPDGSPPAAQVFFHTLRAHAALLEDDLDTFDRHSTIVLPVLPGFYINTMTHLLRGLSFAGAAASAASTASAASAAFEVEREWMRERAEGNPGSFAHLVSLLDAERLLAAGDRVAALRCYERALTEVRGGSSVWHRALITERAGLAHAAAGHPHTGATLLARAAGEWDTWGATARAATLRRRHRLSASSPAAAEPAAGDRIDLMAVLTAARALSSETGLDRLRARVAEVLGALTGATGVRLVLRDPDGGGWLLSTVDGDVSLTDPRAAGLLPVTAVRFADRTGEPLIVADAAGDGRFLHDPYLADRDVCSLLVMPIVANGAARALLVLENTLSRDAFPAGRLDVVDLIAGQLAVSLENAQLYASLERKVTARTAELASANARLEQLNVTDALTGAANRRGLDDRLESEWRYARRAETRLAIAMIDIDYFKAYNDAYGHLRGDECLRRVGITIRETVRATDLTARYGGEEFAVVLPSTGLEYALVAAERIRSAVEALGIAHARSPYGVVTVSIGCEALQPSHGGLPEKLIEAADLQLYEAKRLRNRVFPAV
ncbi:diguanylate cyclase [Catenuloplanes japonicus]|uniref:diguanylate cyclase n=1 Tax=Catenuloplanes japonicus TaxID=33876 RepID=UPI000526AF71|nr:diguanylate cyclase [Catenuloplanes japonicus]